MGQCCSKPDVKDPGEPVAALQAEVLRSQSFLQGLKVLPSSASWTKGAETVSKVFSWESHILATLFVGLGPAAVQATSVVDGLLADHQRSLAGSAQQKKGTSADDLLDHLFTDIDKKLVSAGKAGKARLWAVGVAVLGDLVTRTVTVASVGCCHALLCKVTGSFAQATATGIPLTDAEDLRSVVAELVQSPNDVSCQAAAYGHVLGLQLPAGSQPASRRTTAGSVAQPGGALSRPNTASGAAAPSRAGSRRVTRAGSVSGEVQAHALGHLHIQIHGHALTNLHPHIVLFSDALAARLSVPDMACVAHHFNPSHVQLLRDAAAQAPKIAPQTGLCRRSPTKRPGQYPSPAKGGPGSQPQPATPTKAHSASPGAQAGSAADLGPAGGAMQPQPPGKAAAAVEAGLVTGVKAEHVQPVIQGPRFNLASLILHHALAAPEYRRHRCTRGKGAWRKEVLAAAATLGAAAIYTTPHPAVTTQPQAGAAAVAAVEQPVGAPALLVLTLQWPLSITSQQVAMMRGVAAARAANPRAESRWHMVRQLMRHMHHHRRRVAAMWETSLSLAKTSILQQKRAAEVLAWKHLSEAVIVDQGGRVRRSTPGATPSPPPTAFCSPRPDEDTPRDTNIGTPGSAARPAGTRTPGMPPRPGIKASPQRRAVTQDTVTVAASPQARRVTASTVTAPGPPGGVGALAGEVALLAANRLERQPAAPMSESTVDHMSVEANIMANDCIKAAVEVAPVRSHVLSEAEGGSSTCSDPGGTSTGGSSTDSGSAEDAAAATVGLDGCVLVSSPRKDVAAPDARRVTADTAVAAAEKQGSPAMAARHTTDVVMVGGGSPAVAGSEWAGSPAAGVARAGGKPPVVRRSGLSGSASHSLRGSTRRTAG